MRPIPSARLVYITVQAGTIQGGKIDFPNVSELRGKQIIGIESLYDGQLTKTPNNQPNIVLGDLAKCALTLRAASKDRQHRWPLTALNIVFTQGIWKEVEPFVPNYQNSFIEFLDTPAATTFSVAFTVYYIDKVIQSQ